MLYYVKSLTLLKFEYKVEIYLNMKLFFVLLDTQSKLQGSLQIYPANSMFGHLILNLFQSTFKSLML